MEALGIAASVVSIAGFALDLSQKLYIFSVTTSAAGEEVNYIARNITNYADALEILAERLDEEEEPVYTKHTVRTVSRLYDQSCDLFDRIEDLIPEPKCGRNDLNLVQKIAWNFKKGRVEFLAGQIEYLKTTVNLVATLLFAGRRMRSRRSHRKSGRSFPGTADLEQTRRRVNIAVVEQVQANDKLADLQEKEIHETRLALQSEELQSDNDSPEEYAQANRLVRLNDLTGVLQLRFPTTDSNNNQKQIILGQADNIFNHLLRNFTNLDVDAVDDDQRTSRDDHRRTAPDSRTDPLAPTQTQTMYTNPKDDLEPLPKDSGYDGNSAPNHADNSIRLRNTKEKDDVIQREQARERMSGLRYHQRESASVPKPPTHWHENSKMYGEISDHLDGNGDLYRPSDPIRVTRYIITDNDRQDVYSSPQQPKPVRGSNEAQENRRDIPRLTRSQTMPVRSKLPPQPMGTYSQNKYRQTDSDREGRPHTPSFTNRSRRTVALS